MSTAQQRPRRPVRPALPRDRHRDHPPLGGPFATPRSGAPTRSQARGPPSHGRRAFIRGELMEPRRITVFDTTLRDGEQSIGLAFTPDEKVAIARRLEQLGVDVIEAGFPVSSEGELAGVRAVAAAVRGPVVAAMARPAQQDLDAAAAGLARSVAVARPHRARVERPPSRAEAEAQPGGGGRAGALGRRLLADAIRRGAVLLRGRVALRSGVPRRALRRRDRRGRERDQPPRHRRLRGAGAVRRAAAGGARALSRARHGDGGGALPRRSRAGDGEHARRRRRRGGPDRVHDERTGRARRERSARGGGQRARRPPRRARRRDRESTPPSWPRRQRSWRS